MSENVKKIPKKYRITELLTILYGNTANKARRELITQLEISRGTLSQDENIESGSDKTIQRSRIIAYAMFFGIKPDELTTKVVSNGQPVS